MTEFAHNYIYIRESIDYKDAEGKYVKLDKSSDLYETYKNFKLSDSLIPSFFSRIININNYNNEIVEALIYDELKSFYVFNEKCGSGFFKKDIIEKIDEILEMYDVKFIEINAAEINNYFDKRFQEENKYKFLIYKPSKLT